MAARETAIDHPFLTERLQIWHKSATVSAQSFYTITSDFVGSNKK